MNFCCITLRFQVIYIFVAMKQKPIIASDVRRNWNEWRVCVSSVVVVCVCERIWNLKNFTLSAKQNLCEMRTLEDQDLLYYIYFFHPFNPLAMHSIFLFGECIAAMWHGCH